MKRLLGAAACVLLTGCSRYSDFTLPLQSGRDGRVDYEWVVTPSPVIPRGAAGAFDDVDALNPSVVIVNGRYWNLYSGYDGAAWHTGLAVSSDGLAWSKQGAVLSPDARGWEGDYIAANGSALHH
ncbi:MAG TPA: hypothetical protein VER03_10490, partial [Bryobacteraceae bacterium]|nr:hypothetical protein [Bryobacteraceae bacterium]